MTIMPLNHQILVLDTVAAHNGLLAAVNAVFRSFESAVASSDAVDIEAALTESQDELKGYRGLHETMRNEWSSFAGAITTAYANFRRDVVTRLGEDEQSQVRNLARSIAAGAHKRISDNARAHLTRTLEGIRD